MDVTEEGGQIEAQLNFISESKDLILLNYLVDAISYNGVLQTKISKSGDFLAAQNLPIPLSTISVPMQNTDSLRIIIRILQEQQLLLIKDFTWVNALAIGPLKNEVAVDIQKPIINKVGVVSSVENAQSTGQENNANIKQEKLKQFFLSQR